MTQILLNYLLLKYVHVLGAIVILGTGTGIAFFMLMAHFSKDAAFISRTASVVVLADFIFTASAVVVQPLSGYALLRITGSSLSDKWVLFSLILYAVAGVFWLPVIWIQLRLRDLATNAVARGTLLPPSYHRLFWIWFVFGIPGFASVMVIVWLMIAKPT